MSQNANPLRKYRTAKGMSARSFADVLGIPLVTLYSLENGTKAITAERAKAIEERTEAGLTRHDLRPDLFGDLPRPRRVRTAA